MSRIIDETGKRVGRWRVVGRALKGARSDARWLVVCDCGTEKVLRGTELRRGRSKSCGCLARELLRNRLTKANGEAGTNAFLSGYKASAQRRKLVWSISDEEFVEIASHPCYYCGAKPIRKRFRPGYASDTMFNGVDRVNNDEGYWLGNLVSCCKACNLSKRTRSVKEFCTWAARLYHHLVDTGLIGEPDGL